MPMMKHDKLTMNELTAAKEQGRDQNKILERQSGHGTNTGATHSFPEKDISPISGKKYLQEKVSNPWSLPPQHDMGFPHWYSVTPQVEGKLEERPSMHVSP